MLNLAALPRLAHELVGASLWAQVVDDPIAGISWPSLGIAGGSIITVLGLLGWLVRRQANGAWISAAEHKASMDRADAQHARELASKQAEVDAWRGAHDTLAVTHGATTTALADSIEANRANDRAWDLLTRGITGGAPREGDNRTKPAEGVTT